jgi:transposase-like protein
MFTILPGIASLAQHLQHLASRSEDYRPVRCPGCGRSGVWCHGFYTRKADRSAPPGSSLNPIPIPRFYCSGCRRTCSTLPECLPPRRWYLWVVPQALVLLLCAGGSLAAASRVLAPSEATLGRWWRRLRARFPEQVFALRHRYPDLGRVPEEPLSFWRACLASMTFAHAMGCLHQGGIAIP